MPERRMDHEVDSFDIRAPLRTLLRVVRQRPLAIAVTTLLTVAGVVVYAKLIPPTFEARVRLLAESPDDRERERFYTMWQVFRKDDVKSEPHLIAGGSVLAETMKRLDLGWYDIYHPLTSQLAYWWSQSWIGDQYRAVKHFFFPPAETKWDLTEREKEQLWALVDFKAGTMFQPVGGGESTVGELIVLGPSPRVAQIANTIVDVYLEQRLERHRREGEAAYDVLTEHVDAAFAELTELEDELQGFEEENAIYLDFENDKANVARWASLELSMVDKRAALGEAEAELREVERALAEEPEVREVAVNLERNAIKETLRTSILNNEIALVDTLQRFSPTAPEVEDIETTLEELRARYEAEDDMVVGSRSEQINNAREVLEDRRNGLLARIAGLEAHLAVLEPALEDHEERLAQLPEKQRELTRLRRAVEVVNGEYRVLLDKQIQARMSMRTVDSIVPSVKVIESAIPPSKPNWPKMKWLVLGGILAGVAMGIAVAWVLDMLDNRVRLHHLETGRRAPLLGHVDLVQDGGRLPDASRTNGRRPVRTS